MKKQFWVLLIATFVLAKTGLADTLTHKTEDIIYHGYPTEIVRHGKTVVMTQEKGEIELSLADYEIEYNTEGRNNTIALFSIIGAIQSETVTEAFINELKEAANGGHRMILIEIESPGGRLDLCKNMVMAISKITYTEVVAFITGGEIGGAYNPAAVLSLACNKIYMNPSACIGAATMTAYNRNMKDVLGPDTYAKFISAWRIFVAGTAEKNKYPSALAEAMVDKDIEVIEVERLKKKHYIKPDRKKEGDKTLRIICKEGDILTLTAKQAVEYGVSTAIYETREGLLAGIGQADAQIVESEKLNKAKVKYKEIMKEFGMIATEIQDLIQTAEKQRLEDPEAAKVTIEKLIKKFESLLKMKEEIKTSDIPISIEQIEEALVKYEVKLETLEEQLEEGN